MFASGFGTTAIMESGALGASIVESMSEGRVGSIHIAPDGDTLPHAVDRIRADAGLGLVGDRYYRATGTGKFSIADKPGQDITLIEAEALEGTTS
jgi:hypothetical protein